MTTRNLEHSFKESDFGLKDMKDMKKLKRFKIHLPSVAFLLIATKKEKWNSFEIPIFEETDYIIAYVKVISKSKVKNI